MCSHLEDFSVCLFKMGFNKLKDGKLILAELTFNVHLAERKETCLHE